MGWFTRRVLVCVVLGVALTIASAWVPGALVGLKTDYLLSGSRYSTAADGCGSGVVLSTSGYRAPGIAWVTSEAFPSTATVIFPNRGPEAEMAAWAKSFGWAAPVARLQRWCWTAGAAVAIEIRGWPLSVAWCEHWQVENWQRPGPEPIHVEGAFVLGSAHAAPPEYFGRSTAGLATTLPYRVIWSGAILNTVFWSALVAVAASLPGLVRRLRRRRAGRCPSCGYDLTGAPGPVCAECGAARESP